MQSSEKSLTGPGKRLRAAVVGAGHFGRYHAQKYAAHPEVELVAIVDADRQRAQSMALEFGCMGSTDLEDIAGGLDLASVATPAGSHYGVALCLLERGVAVLVEKPVAVTLVEADRLESLAQESGCVLQVGHQERFFLEEYGWREKSGRVTHIEVRRMGPPPVRPSDCSVVLDILVHDLDWLTVMAGGPMKVHEAKGEWSDLTGQLEQAWARMEGPGGIRIDVEGSRLCSDRVREANLVTADGRVRVDFVGRTIVGPNGDRWPTPEKVRLAGLYGEHPFGTEDYLGKAIAHFIRCVQYGCQPLITGRDGRNALSTALEIESLLPDPR